MNTAVFNKIINEKAPDIYNDIFFILIAEGIRLYPKKFKPEENLPESRQSKLVINTSDETIECYTNGQIDCIYDINSVVCIVFTKELYNVIDTKSKSNRVINQPFTPRDVHGL